MGMKAHRPMSIERVFGRRISQEIESREKREIPVIIYEYSSNISDQAQHSD